MPRSILLGRPWPAAGQPLFTDEDLDWAVAHAEHKAAAAADVCNLCGLPRSVCSDPDNQFAFVAEERRCWASQAIAQAQSARAGSDGVAERATGWSARLRDKLTRR